MPLEIDLILLSVFVGALTVVVSFFVWEYYSEAPRYYAGILLYILTVTTTLAIMAILGGGAYLWIVYVLGLGR